MWTLVAESRCYSIFFTAAGMEIIRTPPQAPQANAHAERWVSTVRRECTDRMLILGQRHLTIVLAEYTQHYNGHRRHLASAQQPPHPVRPTPSQPAVAIQRRPILNGLIN